MDLQQKTPEEPVVLATTPKELQQVQINKEVADILKYVYQDRKAYYEVNAAIYSEYYEDETVLLKDLLFPEISALYKTEKFKSYKAEPGLFKQRFLKKLNEGDYPALKQAMGLHKESKNANSDISRIESISAVAPTDTAMQIYSNSSGVSIYFPYSENFGANFTPSYFDNINTDPWGNMATIVAADREADSAPGNEPYRMKRTNPQTMDIEWYIAYRSVTVNDAYAEIKVSHIVGVGAEPARIMDNPSPPPPPGSAINRVYQGWSRLSDAKQWDKFISFSGNGGGSEIKVCRISGYLKFENEQVTNFAGDVHTVNFTRKDIRKKRWKRTYAVWDPDWKTENTEQVYAVYEEDTKGEQTFTGNLTTTATIPIPGTTGTATASRALTYSIKVVTQDELITQRKQDRYSYFRDAKNSQGWGFEMCDDKGCRYDTEFLPAGQYWPKWDEGSAWAFTWSYKTY